MSVPYDRMGLMPRLGSGIPLVGRRAELERLRAALATAGDGEPGAVLLAGDAGVGKTRLLAELTDEAEAAGALVLTGRCLDIAEHGLPYLAFADALAPLTAHPDASVAAAVRARPALGRLLPQLAGAAPVSPERPLVPVEQETPGRARPEQDVGQLQLFDAVLGLIAELAESRVVMLVVEDLHWADSSTRDLLAFLLSRARRQRLLIVASYRQEDVHRAHPLRPLLAQLEDALREAVQHHVLVIDTKCYSFRHALLREAVYRDLLPGERVRIHATYAQRLIGKSGGRVAALLAYHSLESNDLPTALEASLRAADEAERRGAPSAALRAIEQALRIWDAVPADRRPAATDELALLKEGSYFAGTSGEPERAVAYARSAVDLLDRTAGVDPERAAAVWHRLALALMTSNSTESESPEAIERAWELVSEAEPSATRAWVLATRATLLRAVNRFDAAADSALAAVADAQAAGALGAEADALCTLAALAEKKGDVAQARDRLRDALAKARRAGALSVELRARYFLGLTHDDDAEYEQALAVYREGAERAAEVGLLWSGYGLELRAHSLYLSYLTGEWPEDDPMRWDRGAPTLAANRMASAYVHLLIARGRFDEAQRLLDDLSPQWRTDLGIARAVGAAGAELAEWRGDHEGAMRIAVRAIHWLDEFEPWLLAGLRLGALGIGAAARAAGAARRRADPAAEAAAIREGEWLLAHVRECAQRGLTRGATLGPEGLAWLARADAEASGLSGPADPARWERAARAFDQGAVYEQALCRLRHAEALLVSADGSELAGQQLGLVHGVAQRLRAVPLAGAVRELARRARIRLPGERAPRDVLDPLTARERAVLERVALGRTNRQVGEELYISEKTVSVHLSRVMAKLGAHRRAEAVAIAYDRGLLAAPEGAARA